VIDLHSHVIPALDDGPTTLDGSLEILDAAQTAGVTRIAATPHVRDDHPTTPEQMERGVAELRQLAPDGLEVLTGGELDHRFLRTLDDAALRRFGLGGNPALLLLETPFRGWPLDLRGLVFDLELRGFRVVLAHPERNAEVQERPELVRDLVDAGVAVQLTAGSVEGRLGRRPAATAKALLERGLAHLIASDAHASSLRAFTLRAAAEAIGDRALARWLTHDVPGALLEGRTLPPRPGRRRTMRLPWHR
jgi:protein-tyrosine phosphatase